MKVLNVNFNGEVFPVDFGSSKEDIRELLSTIINHSPSDIVGFQDEHSNFFTLDSLTRDESINSTFSCSFRLLCKNNYFSEPQSVCTTSSAEEIDLGDSFNILTITNNLLKKQLISDKEYSLILSQPSNLPLISAFYRFFTNSKDLSILHEIKLLAYSPPESPFSFEECVSFISLLPSNPTTSAILTNITKNKRYCKEKFTEFTQNLDLDLLLENLKNTPLIDSKDILRKLLTQLGSSMNNFKSVMLKLISERDPTIIEDLHSQSKLINDPSNMVKIVRHTVLNFIDETFFSLLVPSKREELKKILAEKNERLYTLLANSRAFHDQTKMKEELEHFLKDFTGTIKEIKFKSPNAPDTQKFINYIKKVSFLSKYQKENIISMMKIKDIKLKSIFVAFQRKKSFRDLKLDILRYLEEEFSSEEKNSFNAFVDEKLVGNIFSVHEGNILKYRYKMLDSELDQVWSDFKDKKVFDDFIQYLRQYLEKSKVLVSKENWPILTPGPLNQSKELLFKNYDPNADKKIILRALVKDLAVYKYLTEEELQEVTDMIEFEDENLYSSYESYRKTNNHEDLAENISIILKLNKKTENGGSTESQLCLKEKRAQTLFEFFVRRKVNLVIRERLLGMLDKKNEQLMSFVDFFMQNGDEEEFQENLDLILDE